jgi:hypothetical protein
MKPEHLYTIRWTQPYATQTLRPYLRGLQEAMENAIEAQVQRNDCPEARALIERIKQKI